jgi:transcription antitermination protein NusB
MPTDDKSQGPRVSTRHRARRAAVQALYQWQATLQEPTEIARQFNEDAPRMDKRLFKDLLFGTLAELPAIDEALTPHLGRAITQVDPVERAVIRLAGFELMRRLEVPMGVVLNEAVELAKTFGAESGHRYVNGVLDKLATDVRPEASAVRAKRKSR